VTIKNQELIVEQMTTDIQSIKRINEELIELDREAEESRNNLNSIITDIETTEDSIEKEIKVNSMFRDRMRCMELATGSIPAKDETNTICPHYLK
jgi:peptidoglycan hydrolase CwlO-like protein